MGKLKSERHHWWPECVSSHWKNEQGCVHWLSPDGTEKVLPPKNCGLIGNGHHVKLGAPGEATVWDHSFEAEFQLADSNFPVVVEWLKSIEFSDRRGAPISERFTPLQVPEEMLGHLVEGIVSLAVRSPQTRETGVALAEQLRGALPEAERNVLIGSNLRGTQESVVRNIGTYGKFAIIYSPDREFIFGDGFFHTLIAGRNPPMSPYILAPILPRISLLYARPNSYGVEPKVSTVVFDAEEATGLNDAVQVYARRSIFYRSEAPVIRDEFKAGRHLRYTHPNHPIEQIVRSLPGVPPRDHALDELLMRLERSPE